MDKLRSLTDAISMRLIAIGGRLTRLSKHGFGIAGGRGSIFVGLLAGTIWLGAFYMATEDADRTEAAAYHDTANLARAFEENIIRLIQAYDQILLFARSTYTKNPEAFDLIEWAHRQQFSSEAGFQIVIINETGVLAASTLGMPESPMDLSDREHFQVHLHGDKDELFISKPVLGRVSNKWSIQLSRRIFGSDGSFAGVILVSINPFIRKLLRFRSH